jgi:hypothetical protein
VLSVTERAVYGASMASGPQLSLDSKIAGLLTLKRPDRRRAEAALWGAPRRRNGPRSGGGGMKMRPWKTRLIQEFARTGAGPVPDWKETILILSGALSPPLLESAVPCKSGKRFSVYLVDNRKGKLIFLG